MKCVALLLLCSLAYSHAIVALPTDLGGTGSLTGSIGSWLSDLIINKPGSGINFPLIMSKKRASSGNSGLTKCFLWCPLGQVVDTMVCSCKPYPTGTGDGWPFGEIPMVSKKDLGSAAGNIVTGIQNWLVDLIKPQVTPSMVVSKRLFGLGLGSCPICAVYCPFGQKYDATTGCMTCGCNDSPFWTLNPVAVTSKRGEEQELQKPVLCGPVCMIWCPYGNVLNSNGCPTCQCKNALDGSSPFPTIDMTSLMVSKKRSPSPAKKAIFKPECGVVCMIWCPFGKVLDSNGCPTCQCNSNPSGTDGYPDFMVSK
ncbi:uncharacterized protein LOC135483470 isoform X2 [Lineus longissimus]|uniref:uncharacterized protein LOC135483470 isoform X2 n=1 Tax=Lineus longissimus TaxID=88925 RepID=UPI002B4C3840